MTYPDWVLTHKIPSTEIRLIKGRYYLYNTTSVWCPKKKKAKKKTLNQVGVITEEYGLIPTGMSRKGRVPKGASKLKDSIPEVDFLDKFEEIEDPRSERNRLHTISEILLVTFCGVICNANGWRDIESYGKAKIAYLRKYLPYKNGIPSDDTIRRFFRNVNTDHFQQIFRDWVKNLVTAVGVKAVSYTHLTLPTSDLV